ncbi:hypothetical protein NC652_034085 [Populus alba x Populus x berolinensis]|nr:hypothetical protein NC652_034085 [Populus alba x Populus x berolinensis]
MPGFYGAIVAVLFPARNQWHGCEEGLLLLSSVWLQRTTGYVLGIKHTVIFSTQGTEGIKILKAACCASRFYRPSLNIRMRHGNEASMRFRGIHRMSAIHRVEINLASQS